MGSGRPDGRGGAVGGDVSHYGGAEEHRCDVVGPLVADDAGAVPGVVGAVVDVVVGAVYQADPGHPVIGLLGPVAVRAVSCVSSQARGELEEGAVGDAGFVVESGVLGVELPLEAAVAGGCVPARTGHVVEDVLGERDVGDVGGRGEGEGALCGRHGSEAPKELIVVALRLHPISAVPMPIFPRTTCETGIHTS